MWRALVWWRPPCLLLRSVILNLRSDREVAFTGVLWRARGAWLTLTNVSAVRATGSAPLDGDLVVHRSNVAFLQVLPPGEGGHNR